MKSDKKLIKDDAVRNVIYAFLAFLLGTIIPYFVRIVDIGIIFLRALTSKKDRGVYTIEEILNQDYNQPMNKATVLLFTFLLFIIAFGIWYRENSFEEIKDKGGVLEITKTSIKKLFTGPLGYLLILTGISTQFMVDGILGLVRNLAPDAMSEYDKVVTATANNASVLMYIVLFIFAPIGEELLFRGVMQGHLKKARSNAPVAIVIVAQALCFGIYHGVLIQSIYAAILGLALGYIVYLSDSIIPAIILHMSINISVLFMFESMFSSVVSCALISIAAALIFAVSIYATIRCLKGKKILNIKKKEELSVSDASEN